MWNIHYFLLASLCVPTLAAVENFFEELSLRNLNDGKVASRFSFTTRLEGVSPRDPRTLGFDDEAQHYRVFPLALGQILREYGVSELHLTLNAGRWDYDRWGYPEEKGVGTGAELWAWMGDGAPMSIDNRWKGLRNALAGLFCASLGSMDERRTTSPSQAFPPEGTLPSFDLPHQLRHASLPSEHVCTENLTPFLKLLPCKSLSGIASLLNPHRLFDADWHGMGVHVLWREEEGVELRLAFQSVMDPLRYSLSTSRDWSFQSLFSRVVNKTCPVAVSSRVTVASPQQDAIEIKPDPSIEGEAAFFDVATVAKPLNVAMHWQHNFQYPLGEPIPLTPLSVQRTLKGSSQDRGQLSLVIINHEPTTVYARYLETMPWLVQFYLHTLQARAKGITSENIISNFTYVPAVPHSRPTTFEAMLSLPPCSTVHLTMDVTKAFLRYTEHQPDAQRGWDLPPAVITPVEPLNSRMYTAGLLVDLATPDFSMPYNVIIFTCSLMAFIFGSAFNLLTRKFVVVRLD